MVYTQITIVFMGFINQVITGGAPHCTILYIYNIVYVYNKLVVRHDQAPTSFGTTLQTLSLQVIGKWQPLLGAKWVMWPLLFDPIYPPNVPGVFGKNLFFRSAGVFYGNYMGDYRLVLFKNSRLGGRRGFGQHSDVPSHCCSINNEYKPQGDWQANDGMDSV